MWNNCIDNFVEVLVKLLLAIFVTGVLTGAFTLFLFGLLSYIANAV